MRPIILLAMLLITGLSQPTWAQQFRIETQIYVGDVAETASENTTLFAGGLVFDVQNKGGQTHEVAILDPSVEKLFCWTVSDKSN